MLNEWEIAGLKEYQSRVFHNCCDESFENSETVFAKFCILWTIHDCNRTPNNYQYHDWSCTRPQMPTSCKLSTFHTVHLLPISLPGPTSCLVLVKRILLLSASTMSRSLVSSTSTRQSGRKTFAYCTEKRSLKAVRFVVEKVRQTNVSVHQNVGKLVLIGILELGISQVLLQFSFTSISACTNTQ